MLLVLTSLRCQECGRIVEEGILMSEVGFSEGAGGRVHVQGTFVSNFSTGIPGFRGRAKEETAHQVKTQGTQRIKMIAEDMRIETKTAHMAARWFGLAVDHKFTRGRRTEYILAACIYLQCRLVKENVMLIDFSERLAVNVYELGATYLRLRSTLNLPELLPEVDPAIYNIRFAKHLDFPETAIESKIATDASRLVRRFRADWMTQGRRPAGVCGACLVIASRMNGYLRTPEEVAQVVKVSPWTIKRRLLEFAQTSSATKTVDQFSKMEETALDEGLGERPPSVKQRKKKDERIQKLKEALAQEQRKRDGELDDEAEAEGSRRGSAGDEAEDSDDENTRASRGRRGKGKERTNPSTIDDVQDAIQAAAAEIGQMDEGAEGDEHDLEAMEQEDYMAEVSAARDNPEEVEAERRREARAFKARNRAATAAASADLSGIDDSLVGESTQLDSLADTFQHHAEKPDEHMGEFAGGMSSEAIFNAFDKWDDQDATLNYLGERIFAEEKRLLDLNDLQLRERVKGWMAGRDPKEVLLELECCERARAKRESDAKQRPETHFPDIDDLELEGYYVLEDEEMKLRARIWLNHNAKWLEEDKERQAKKAAYAKARGLDPNKPKKRKKRVPRQGPFTSTKEAIDTFASTKKFSSRLNYSVLQNLGLAKDEVTSLQSFDDDEKDDEKEDDMDEDDKDGECQLFSCYGANLSLVEEMEEDD
ncbi:hypothetical protein BD324DRAFT_577073 [Kockovaella imperatae]|uniref:B-related factor 1 n=1 Tax=Kockovaella imperatae TaxID=4999 RepID=A0A1Y1UNQ7_9TREE|nr:hypothetical protein BD324DRAFT_577073 [Kockovaella imperatae]ORX39134.1 hypothetical protein BD324DRAFT_577073 [Kockovaella imperatae]